MIFLVHLRRLILMIPLVLFMIGFVHSVALKEVQRSKKLEKLKKINKSMK